MVELRHDGEWANASIKRIATQNEKAIRNLRLGMVISIGLSVLFRLLFRQQTFTSKSSILAYALTCIPTLFLSSFLIRAGTPRRDASGTLISPGSDLNQPGLTDWSWDVIYVTWTCQVGSSLLGDWVWWLYLVIPIYAGYKAWTSFISPILLGRTSGAGTAESELAGEPGSKRQEKLRKRQEKGDPRVRAMPLRK